MDDPPTNLHSFIEGTHEDVIKILCQGSDTFFDKIKVAVSKMEIPTKRSKIEDDLPTGSEYGKKAAQHNIPGICNHRYYSGLHTTLQVEAFGKFCDIMRSDDQLDSKFYETAALVMVEMSKEFKDEGTRLRKFFSITSDIFAATPIAVKCRGKGKSDGTAVVVDRGKEFYVANWEFKNEMLGISSEPTFENKAYFVHLQKGVHGRLLWFP